MSEVQQYELTGITRDGKVTMVALLLFGLYPQAFYPQLSIIATCVSAEKMVFLIPMETGLLTQSELKACFQICWMERWPL